MVIWACMLAASTARYACYHILRLAASTCVISCFLFFFFFQAEDGIRDIGVTGVQTCALPIFWDAAGKEVLSQSVDTDFDDYHLPDMVIFQADFAPNQTQTFTVTAGAKRE